MQINVTEAKAKLSELVAAAERGEEVIIARGGRPVVRLVAADSVPDFLEPMSKDELREWGA